MSDGDLAKLGSLRKANPHKADWTPMQLFLESQVGACGIPVGVLLCQLDRAALRRTNWSRS